MLRTRRGLGFTVAVSSGQELVTTAAEYAEYALGLPETRVLALVLEAIREPAGYGPCSPPPRPGTSRWCCSPRAARRAAGPWCRPTPARWPPRTAAGRRWPAAYGVHRVGDLAELADTWSCSRIGPAAAPPQRQP